jgi:23S rRNA pseudouridine2605 synthase
MHEQQLQELRREKWRLNGRPIGTLDEAREFIDSVGFCLLYPQRPAVLLPTFVGAYAGSDEHLPARQMAFADPSARDAKHLMVRLLREKAAYETNVFPDNNFIVSASVFPYFYGLVGDRNPRQAPKAGARSEYSPLAIDAFQIIRKEGPISEHRLRELLGGDISAAALDRALDELWAKLRITRVDYSQEKGVFWDVLFRWSPEAVKEGMHVSVAEALTALVSKYLDCVLAAQHEEVEQFFSNLIGRARVREAISTLQAARELSFVHVAGRVLLQVSSLELPAVHQVERKFKLQPRFAPQPPRPGKPLVQRRPRKSPSSSTPVPPAKDAGKE